MAPRFIVAGALALACGGVRVGAAPDSRARLPVAPRLFTPRARTAVFERNTGQLASTVTFAARSRTRSLLLTSQGAVWTAADAPVLRMQFAGGRLRTPSALEPQSGYVNYFLGANEANWRSRVPTHGRILYHDVYPNVDVAFYGAGPDVEYDVVMRPGGRVSDLALAFDRADAIAIDAAGDLIIRTRGGELRQRRPVAWQTVDGVHREVRAAFTIDRRHRVRFDVGEYDRTQPLVIDPVLIYSTYLGGGNEDRPAGIGRDAAGNVYVAGTTGSTNFPTPGGLFPSASGSQDCFVTKFAPDGTVVYSTYYGGTQGESTCRLAVTAGGEVYLAGTTWSSDLPVASAMQPAPLNPFSSSGFVAKFSADGTALVFSTYFGGTGGGEVRAVTTNADGDVILAAIVKDAPFSFTSTIAATSDVLAKMTGSGSLAWATQGIGGAAIALDGAGAIYLTGQTSGGLVTTPGAFQTTQNADTAKCQAFHTLITCPDAFVTKVAPDGQSLVYSTYLREVAAGSVDSTDVGTAIAVDASGNAYVTGYTRSRSFPTTPGAYDTLCGASGTCPLRGLFAILDANGDVFVTKLNPTGTALVFSTFLGGASPQAGMAIAVDDAERAWVGGHTFSGDFPVTPDALRPTGPGGDATGAFLTVFSADGSALEYSTFLGVSPTLNFVQTTHEALTGIALGPSGDVYLAGFTASDSFPARRPWQPARAGGIDGFVTRLTTMPARLAVESPSASASVAEPFSITGWAVDLAANSGVGMDAVYVWAYPDPGSGTPPTLLGGTPVNGARPDVAAQFGAQFTNAGFGFPVHGLAAGTYDFAVFGHSVVTNTYPVLQVVRATLVQNPHMWLDLPANGSMLDEPFLVAGWALDGAAASGTGVDAVQVYAFPNGDPARPIFLGLAAPMTRPDVGAAFGDPRYDAAGFAMWVGALPSGNYLLTTYAHSTVTESVNQWRTAAVTVRSRAVVFVDTPAAGASVPPSFPMSGWAIDPDAVSDSGVSALAVWAFPTSGGGPVLVGMATAGLDRPDIAAAFGPQYAHAGWSIAISSLPPGTYDLAVYPYRTSAGAFTDPAIVRVTVTPGG